MKYLTCFNGGSIAFFFNKHTLLVDMILEEVAWQ